MKGRSSAHNHLNQRSQVWTHVPVCLICEVSLKSAAHITRSHQHWRLTTFETAAHPLFAFLVVWLWIHVVIKLRLLLLQCWEKALMMGEHPWLVILRRQRSRFTLLIQSILCWRGVAKQPQGTEWDSNSGDLELHRACWSLFLSCEVLLLTFKIIF